MQIRTPVKKLTGERAVFLLPETVVFLHGRFLSRAIRASPSRKSDNSAVRAFTLIELLAAIAVIALLAALLFPLASRMIVKSQTSKCAANLRQIYSASLLWSQENDNAMLLTFPTLNPTPTSTWDQALRPYLGIDSTWPSAQNAGKRPPSVFACPASKSLTTLSRLSDYGKNAFVNNPYPVPTQGPAYRWAGFNSASKVIFLADARGEIYLHLCCLTHLFNRATMVKQMCFSMTDMWSCSTRAIPLRFLRITQLHHGGQFLSLFLCQ